MGYMKAEEILPIELIELIQQYVDGEAVYIPRKAEHRQAWAREHRSGRSCPQGTGKSSPIILKA